MLPLLGYIVNHKRVYRLMRAMGIMAIYTKPNLSKPDKAHKVYPYLLKEITIDRPNQVWATDITYIPMANGFIYLTAIMGWHSRKVLSWRLSNTMDVKVLKEHNIRISMDGKGAWRDNVMG